MGGAAYLVKTIPEIKAEKVTRENDIKISRKIIYLAF